ncbi:hypothetical protein C8F01DRAFT_1134108 [Mycena amicta]|nr:hypothetical protein C8F01DRAFT_1134108 [Mycena amicta]
MFLVLTSPSTSNTVYTDESGVPQYQVDTRTTRASRTSSIRRLVPASRPRSDFDFFAIDVDLRAPQHRSTDIATIRWNIVQSSVIDFAGRERKTKSWLKREDVAYGFSPRVMTAQDGREYRWMQDRDTSELQLRTNDLDEILVARFHTQKHFPTFSPTRPLAALEVLPQFEQMADEILVTFVYIDNRGGKSPSRSPSRRGSGF